MALAAAAVMPGCTDLDEELFHDVTTDNYFNTKQDVIRMAFRPFEHAFWCIQDRHYLNEQPADQLITPMRDTWYDDGGVWQRIHYHQWDTDDTDDRYREEWTVCYQGIGQCNYVIENLEAIDLLKFGFREEEADNIKAQCRALRAWFYIQLLDFYRNIPLVVSFNDQTLNSPGQVEPKVIFEFIEKELKDCVDLLVAKEAIGTQAKLQGQITKAAAAAMLMRLYLNAEVYIGEDHYADCAAVGEAIMNGTYGPYQVADRWDAPFDWDNDTCDEVIFGFPASGGYSYWHMTWATYWYTVPFNARYYLNDHKAKAGQHNAGWACAPSLDLNGQYYDHELGCPVRNFKKYPGDVRLKLYRNLGGSKREGMFLYGYLEYIDDYGNTQRVKSPTSPYEIYIRDAVGPFRDMAPDQWPSNKTSNMRTGDMSSGWHFAKYPFYSDDDEHQMESDYTEIRYPEVIYSLAECYLRTGRTQDAAKLLNSVRRRNYPEEYHRSVLYSPEGRVKLDMDEMLAEWGREFFAESRRRIDLIRFGKFSTGTWWDKSPDSGDHTNIFPIARSVLNVHPEYVQNPGYNK